jgi:predicted signal transduction protein with EAL and GGDEF domain
MQGYLFARPMPAEKVETHLRGSPLMDLAMPSSPALARRRHA